MVTLPPLVELARPSLHKHSHHTSPVLILQGLGVVGDVELDLPASQSVLEINPLLETHVPNSFLVLPIDQKLLNVAQTQVTGMQVFRNYQNRILLLGQQSVDPHLAVNSVLALLSRLTGNEQAEQRSEVGAGIAGTETPCF